MPFLADDVCYVGRPLLLHDLPFLVNAQSCGRLIWYSYYALGFLLLNANRSSGCESMPSVDQHLGPLNIELTSAAASTGTTSTIRT